MKPGERRNENLINKFNVAIHFGHQLAFAPIIRYFFIINNKIIFIDAIVIISGAIIAAWRDAYASERGVRFFCHVSFHLCLLFRQEK